DEEPCSAFEAWRRLYGAEHIEPQPDTAFVDGVFDLALAPNVALPGGGRINISPTKALVAIDVDRLGREDKGSAGARALAIGAEAVQTAIQQLILRNLGGLCVIDLPGPLNKGSGERLQMAALQSFERHTLPEAKVLKPSSLGLIEMSLPWRFRPLRETLVAEGPEASFLAILRDAHQRLTAEPAALFCLNLDPADHSIYVTWMRETAGNLAQRYSGRLLVKESSRTEVVKRS
ncbi:MAG: ribonuclease E/G, partial [Pseudomonadota bacterium]